LLVALQLQKKCESQASLDEMSYYLVVMMFLFEATDNKVLINGKKNETDEELAIIPLRKEEGKGTILDIADYYGISSRLVFYFLKSFRIEENKIAQSDSEKLQYLLNEVFESSLMCIGVLKYLLKRDTMKLKKVQIEGISDSLYTMILYKVPSNRNYSTDEIEKFVSQFYNVYLLFKIDNLDELVTYMRNQISRLQTSSINRSAYNKAVSRIEQFFK